MKSIYRWIANNTGFCRGIMLLGLGAIMFYAATLENVPIMSVYLFVVVIWFFVARFISMASSKLMEEPAAICDQQCDPYPLLDTLKQMLDRKQNPAQQQMTQINYALALRLIGENHQCADILEKINIDRFPGTSPYSKFIYYNNLSDVLFLLGRELEAKIWQKKSMQIYNDLPANKMKQQFDHTVQLAEAEDLYRAGDYDLSLRKAAWIDCRSTRQLLDTALLAAKCHIALEETEKAREKLQYIIDNGNKLHIVEEARQLLETLE